jgi:hypothetical protein
MHFSVSECLALAVGFIAVYYATKEQNHKRGGQSTKVLGHICLKNSLLQCLKLTIFATSVDTNTTWQKQVKVKLKRKLSRKIIPIMCHLK